MVKVNSTLEIKEVSAASVNNAGVGSQNLFIDSSDNSLKTKTNGGIITAIPSLLKDSGVFTTGTNITTITNSNCKEDSLIEVIIDSSVDDSNVPNGIWEVESNDGNFVITSTETETKAISFKYYIFN